MSNGIVIGLSFGYLALLFAIASFIEGRSQRATRLVRNPYVYALSLCVYCTAWTYYGSVGRAAAGGIEFLSIYLGPSLMASVFWLVLRKIIRICKVQRITSIADFISSRYGKSSLLGVVITLFCLLEAIPYTALQLKAISNSLYIIANPDTGTIRTGWNGLADVFSDATFYITLGLAFFVILFGTRRVDTTEQHAGMVGAIAFETLVKLLAFLAGGLFVTYGVFNGFGDIFTRAAQRPEWQNLFVLGQKTSYANWLWTIFLSAMAVMFLPRQFQAAVVENTHEKHLDKAMWLFPLYLLIMNIFVLPIAFGGKLVFVGANVDADTYVLALPLYFQQHLLTLLVYIGGFSAATGMVIVAAIALSTMTSNNLIMPLLVKSNWFKQRFSNNFVPVLLYSRRVSIVFTLLLSYAYFKIVAGYYPLVSIGLVAFAAVAQFAPAVLGGIFWKGGSRHGALAGLLAGFVIWFYTLLVPSVAGAHMLPESLMTEGPLGLGWLRPTALFGLDGLDSISHTMFWSMFLNVSLYVGVSLFSQQNALERSQAEIFVDIFKYSKAEENTVVWKGTAYIPDIQSLLVRFLGERRTEQALQAFYRKHRITQIKSTGKADARLVSYAEKLLAGAIGTASARIMVASVVKDERIDLEGVVDILRESQQLMRLNKELQQKSLELEKATNELRDVNARLKQMDEQKDEFLSTVTHELRTPVTAIRAFSEILYDNPDLDEAEKRHFLETITKETARMNRLISQVLDLEKYESGKQVLQTERLHVAALITEATDSVAQLARERHICLETNVPDHLPEVVADRDRILQVLLNLLSNAIKFCDAEKGRIWVAAENTGTELQISVTDNGNGIDTNDHELIFNKFYQIRNQHPHKPIGSGLGLSISRKIVELHQGRIWVESTPGQGSTFRFALPHTGPAIGGHASVTNDLTQTSYSTTIQNV